MDNYNYPEGADNKFAPWNQPEEPEPEQCDLDEAKSEIYPFVNFEPGATISDINNAVDYLDTDETNEVAEICEACNRPNPLLAVNDELKAVVKKQAEEWVDERAIEVMKDRIEAAIEAAEVGRYESQMDNRRCDEW